MVKISVSKSVPIVHHVSKAQRAKAGGQLGCRHEYKHRKEKKGRLTHRKGEHRHASANPVFYPQGTNTLHKNQTIVTDTAELHRAAQQLAKSSQHSIDMASMVHSYVVPVLLLIFKQLSPGDQTSISSNVFASVFPYITFQDLYKLVQYFISCKSLQVARVKSQVQILASSMFSCLTSTCKSVSEKL